jgi:hypothetical protein
VVRFPRFTVQEVRLVFDGFRPFYDTGGVSVLSVYASHQGRHFFAHGVDSALCSLIGGAAGLAYVLASDDFVAFDL